MEKAEGLQQLQNIELQMLKQIDKMCTEQGLHYTLCGGSLLGAVRHKGFIPWDDDIDILMPREDYDRFVREGNSYLPEGLKLFDYTLTEDVSEIMMHHAVIQNTKTMLRAKWATEEREIGIWIDVYPLDGMPGKGGLRTKLHYWHYTFWYVMMQFSWFERTVKLDKPNRPFSERALIKFYQITHFGRNFNTKKILLRMDKLLRKYPLKGATLAADLKGSYRQKEILPTSLWDETIRVPFEDGEANIPAGYDGILSQMYGDYMTPPTSRAEKEDRHQFEIIEMSAEETEGKKL